MSPLTAARLNRSLHFTNGADSEIRRSHCSAAIIGPLLVDPPILQAPMAGLRILRFGRSCAVWRGGTIGDRDGFGRGFVWMDRNEAEHPDRLWGVKDEPRPLAVQMWDNDPETLAKVASDWRKNIRSASSISISAARCAT